MLGVAIPVIAQEASELLAAVGERVTNRRSFAHQSGIGRFRDHVEQVDGGAGEVGGRDPPRHRDSHTRGELGGPHLPDPAVAVEREQVVAGGHPHPATRPQRDLEDPVLGPLVPTRDGVVPDPEGLGIEAHDVAALLLAHDVADRAWLQHAVVEDHDGLARGKARVDEEAEPAKTALSLEPRHEIVGQRDALERGAEHELAGVEDERAVVADLDQLGEILLVLLRVDVGRGVVAEHAEVAVDVQVDRRRLDARRRSAVR